MWQRKLKRWITISICLSFPSADMESDSHLGWELIVFLRCDCWALIFSCLSIESTSKSYILLRNNPFQLISRGRIACQRLSPAWRRTETRRGRRTGSSGGKSSLELDTWFLLFLFLFIYRYKEIIIFPSIVTSGIHIFQLYVWLILVRLLTSQITASWTRFTEKTEFTSRPKPSTSRGRGATRLDRWEWRTWINYKWVFGWRSLRGVLGQSEEMCKLVT